jgi:hypothetical protein
MAAGQRKVSAITASAAQSSVCTFRAAAAQLPLPLLLPAQPLPPMETAEHCATSCPGVYVREKGNKRTLGAGVCLPCQAVIISNSQQLLEVH